MLSLLQNWKGKIEVNGKLYDNLHSIPSHIVENDVISIKLYPQVVEARTNDGRAVTNTDNKEVRITVKQYMTRQATPEFDFMAKWNNDNPMPLRTMQGTVIQETKGMVKMKLHGAGLPEVNCIRCGKKLTHLVSRHYGIGPECMQKVGIIADIDDVENIKEQLVNVTWEGWVIKSAITEQEEV